MESIISEASPRRGSSADAGLRRMRKRWAEETTKRIHVVVRVRPLNIREIKEGAKVGLERRGGGFPPSGGQREKGERSQGIRRRKFPGVEGAVLSLSRKLAAVSLSLSIDEVVWYKWITWGVGEGRERGVGSRVKRLSPSENVAEMESRLRQQNPEGGLTEFPPLPS